MPKKVTINLTDEERFACEYFMRTDARRSYPDVYRSQLLKSYQKIPKERRAEHEIECRDKWESENGKV